MKQTATEPIWMTVNQAAAYAQVGRRMVYTAAAQGRLRAARLGLKRALRFRKEWVDAWCESCATESAMPS